VEDPLFKEALQGLNPLVDVTLLQPRTVNPYVSPGLQPNQSNRSTEYMEKIRDAMANHMWENATFE
jgi:hypothetical protein